MMVTLNRDVMSIIKEQDVIPFRNRLKEYAVKIGMSLVNQTKIITAASELVRNMLKYAGGGQVLMEVGDTRIELRAGLPGMVTQVIAERGVVIRTAGALVQAASAAAAMAVIRMRMSPP